MNELEFKNIKFIKDNKIIINNLSLNFDSKKIYSLVGPNGAGKSTIGKLIMGFSGYNKFDGDIIFNNKSIKNLNITKKASLGITMTLQEPVRYSGLSIFDYLSINNPDIEKQKKCLEKVGLDPNLYLERDLDETLSGGERKRVEFASILLMKPKVIILDEPDSGIDISSIDFISDMIHEFQKMHSIVITITHNIEILEKTDYSYLVCNGNLVDFGESKYINKYFKNKCIKCSHKNTPEKIIQI
jgi:Fe-S cluster assembly ATP-binding protein